jgi:hypothetical protein
MGRASRARTQARQRHAMQAANGGGQPPEPPASGFKTLCRRFGGFPGVGLCVGAFQLLWRWSPFLFRRGEDSQFALDLWRSAGGDVPMLVQAVSSPLFGLTIVIGSIVYAFFGKEPAQKVKVHPAIPAIGWAIVIVCGFLTGSVFLFDLFLRESHVAEYVSSLTTDRHLKKEQVEKIKTELSPIAVLYPRALVVFAADTPESDAYAIEIMQVLSQSGLTGC